MAHRGEKAYEPLAPPFFTGGTGRSGTTVIAKLLDQHPLVGRSKPWEARFLTDPRGLCDLVADRDSWHPRHLVDRFTRTRVGYFEQRLRGHWFRRTAGNGIERGLCEGIDAATVEAALTGFRARLRADARAAAVRLTHELLDPPARRRGKPRWMDTTPANAARAACLVRLFPQMRLVHMIRDGRDVAASVAARYWGPDDIDDALVWWEQRMLRAGRGIAGLPAGSVLTLQLEDLVLHRREETLERLLAFLGLPADDRVVAHFRDRMRPEHAHLSRWDAGMDPARRADFAQRYEQALERLTAAGVPVPRSPAALV